LLEHLRPASEFLKRAGEVLNGIENRAVAVEPQPSRESLKAGSKVVLPDDEAEPA
jgi:hypothetical protein